MQTNVEVNITQKIPKLWVVSARFFSLSRVEEGNRYTRLASSKQARLGKMVSQLRKLRLPLMIRITCITYIRQVSG